MITLRTESALCDSEVGDNHGVVATGGNAFVVQVCMRIAGVTGANQAGLAVLERGRRIGALRSGHEPEQWLLVDLPGQKGSSTWRPDSLRQVARPEAGRHPAKHVRRAQQRQARYGSLGKTRQAGGPTGLRYRQACAQVPQ